MARMERGTRALVEWMEEEGVAGDLSEIDWEQIDIAKVTQEQLDTWQKAFWEFFLTKTKEELHKEATKRDIQLFPINNIREVLTEIQLRARDFWVEIEYPELAATLIYPRMPFISTEVVPEIGRAPFIGEHNDEIYMGELDFSKEELRILMGKKVI